MREGLIRVSISTIGIRVAWVRRSTGSRAPMGTESSASAGAPCKMVGGGIKQERYSGGNLQWIKRKIRLWPMGQRLRPATGIMASEDRLNIRAQAQNPLAGVQLGLRTKVQNHQVRQAPQARR